MITNQQIHRNQILKFEINMNTIWKGIQYTWHRISPLNIAKSICIQISSRHSDINNFSQIDKNDGFWNLIWNRVGTNRENSSKIRRSNSYKPITWSRIANNNVRYSFAKQPLPYAYFIFWNVCIFHFNWSRHKAHGTYNCHSVQIQLKILASVLHNSNCKLCIYMKEINWPLKVLSK